MVSYPQYDLAAMVHDLEKRVLELEKHLSKK